MIVSVAEIYLTLVHCLAGMIILAAVSYYLLKENRS